METGKDGGTISFGGLSSGLDTNSIVPALVDKSRAPMRKVEQQQEILGAHQDLLQTVSGMVVALGEQAHRIDTVSKFLVQQATSSNDDAVMATAGDGAANGTYHVAIEQLATAQKTWSRPVDDASAADCVQPGTLRWQYAGQTQALEVDEAKSLTALAQDINRGGRGLSARVLYDGAQYRLQLEGTQAGPAGELKLQEEGLALGLDDPSHTVRTAAEAIFSVDQLRMHRPSNVVHDAIDGVTLVLGEADASATVRISADQQAILRAVEDFVDGYNATVEAVELATKPGRDLERGRMVGDTTLRNMQQALQAAISTPVAGLPGAYKSLSQLGVSSTKEGRLRIDDAKLRDALRQQPLDVARVFGRDRQLGSRGVATATQAVVDRYTLPMTGVLPAKIKSMGQQRDANEARLVQMQNSLDKYESHLRDQFSTLESNMTKMKGQKEFLDQQIKSMSPSR